MTQLKGFRTIDENHSRPIAQSDNLIEWVFMSPSGKNIEWRFANDECLSINLHTGEYDREGSPIYEGDWVRSKSCAEPFQVKDLVSFLKQCGAYEAQHGVKMCDSLVVVNIVGNIYEERING